MNLVHPFSWKRSPTPMWVSPGVAFGFLFFLLLVSPVELGVWGLDSTPDRLGSWKTSPGSDPMGRGCTRCVR